MAIVFFDIDQTLAIGTWIPDSARKGLSLLRENGHKVFLCTGRNVSYARKHFGDLADGFITNNGTLAYYEGDFIYDRPMDHELVQTIVDILEECEAGYAFHSKRQGYYGGPEELYDTVAVVGDEDYLLKGLKELGWPIEELKIPNTTFYLWLPIPRKYDNSTKFCEDLLEKSGVVIVPGSAFGKYGEGYFRISYVCSDAKLQEVIDRMKADGFRF